MVAVKEEQIKTENEKAETWLLDFWEKREAYVDTIQSMQELTPVGATEYTGMPGGGGISSPAETKGLRLVEFAETSPELEIHRRWIETIQDAEKAVPDHHRAFIEFRRRAEQIDFGNRGKGAWFDYVQARYADWYYRQYGKVSVPSRRCFQAWWTNAVNVVVRVAIRRGLL